MNRTDRRQQLALFLCCGLAGVLAGGYPGEASAQAPAPLRVDPVLLGLPPVAPEPKPVEATRPDAGEKRKDSAEGRAVVQPVEPAVVDVQPVAPRKQPEPAAAPAARPEPVDAAPPARSVPERGAETAAPPSGRDESLAGARPAPIAAPTAVQEPARPSAPPLASS